jgi:ABC-2 type transport system permease protein
LRPVGGRGWGLGFGNLLANESRRWWGTRRWLVHLALWLIVINGMVALVSATSTADGLTPAEAYAEIADVFTGALAITTAIGVVAVSQGAIIGERQLGTAAWVLSKPASRSAFVLAKLVANGAALLALAVLVPSAVYYAETLAFFGQAPALAQLAAAAGLLALHLLFYVALTLALGTFFSGRGAVMGIGSGLIVAGMILGGALRPLAQLLPWPLMSIARVALLGAPLPADWFVPVAMTAA